ncbi:glycosyltransferase [Aurantibacter sp.]|uniref:glycosyltransferase n=1 Tax=Aurantibacter sp. TaxID=2807103 RepID=UPI0035C80291
MKILMVAIPNHHFFQWVNQLETSGFEVFWFDISDGGSRSKKIDWVKQFKGWKLKWDYPFRVAIKKHVPVLHKAIQKINTNNSTKTFNNILKEVQPDIIHCFEMQLSGLPILPIISKNNIPVIYSSWGSDLFNYKKLGISENSATSFLNRADYLITDCKRDFANATKLGFKNVFLGVFPGNGGLQIDINKITSTVDRTVLLIKGYNDGVGQAIKVLKAIELIKLEMLNSYQIIVYSADNSVIDYIKSSVKLNNLNIIIHSRYKFIKNNVLLELMGKSVLHIANSTSDGMPNALLEAMAMGSFPIQSNPGRVTEEVITHNKNGFLIKNPLDELEIQNHIEKAIKAKDLRLISQEYNVNYMEKNYNRSKLQSKIEQLYISILNS